MPFKLSSLEQTNGRDLLLELSENRVPSWQMGTDPDPHLFYFFLLADKVAELQERIIILELKCK